MAIKGEKKGRLLITGSGSGSGKTTAVCGILYGLRRLGLQAAAFKCGPDYIDPMFHQRVLGIESGNLDLFFSDADIVCELLEQGMQHADIGIIEGAMGYYDGIGMTSQASAYAVSQATHTPAVLVVNPVGMGASVLALIQGFLNYHTPSGIEGILFNQVSEKRYQTLKRETEKLGISVLGYLPKQKAFTLESRHLGLVTAPEIEKFSEKLKQFYELIKDTIDWQALLALARSVSDTPKKQKAYPPAHREYELTIAVARDEAFCFLYADNLRYLESRGCKLCYFSPIHDTELPKQADGIILCGGYPELYAKALSANKQMCTQIREALQNGLPCIAECGGFLYLQKELTDMDGESHPMTGFLDGRGFRGKGLEHFGYVEVCAKNLFGKENLHFRAHEFHYFDCDSAGEDLWIKKASAESAWQGGKTGDSFYAGFPHVYFYGNETFAQAYLDCAARYGKDRRIESI